MELLNVIIRTSFFYIYIIIIFRIMGKREIGQLSVQDLVVSILIAELVAISIENHNDTILYSILPISLLVIFEVLFGYISIKSNRFRNIIEGKPALIICNGKIIFKELIRQRYSIDDLLLELRINGIKNIEEVEYAVLENNGKLSIFKYNFIKMSSNYPFPIILDGIIQKDTLNYLKKDRKWIDNYLSNNNIKLSNIFYAFYKNDKLFIIEKEKLI